MGVLADLKNAMDPAYTTPHAGANQTVAGNVAAAWGDIKSDFREQALTIVEDAKNSIAEPIRNVITSTMDIAKKAVPTALAASASVQYLGGNASFASFLQPVHVRSKFLLIGTDRGATIGYPLEQYQTLSALSGFVMCENVKFDLAAGTNANGATLEEQQLIKQYLENGCYIE